MNSLLKYKIVENKEENQNIEVSRKITEGNIDTTEELIDNLKKTKTDQIQQNEKDIKINETELDRLNTDVQKFMDSIANDETSKTLRELEGYKNGIEQKMLSSENEIEFYEQNDICGTCNQDLSEEHKTKMIDEHHGIMHKNGTALLSLGQKIENLRIRIEDVTKVQT